MEEHFMTQIWAVIGLKENQSLTVGEQQKAILEILSDFRKASEDWAERSIKNKYKKAILEVLEK